MKFRYIFFFIILTCGCEKIYPEEIGERIKEEQVKADTVIEYEPETVGYVTSNDVLERAFQLASVEWTPIKQVPLRKGVYFKPGKLVKGVPYSSVKEINTYLFQDVSYHTFMTAVHNPNSVFYSEDISKDPYHGVNCALYYGAVCSSAVMYAFGFSIPYYANQLVKLPSIQALEPQLIDSLKVCDIMWKPGHVQMVFNVEHREDTLYRVTTFESAGSTAHITSYTIEKFRELWKKGGYVGYRYKNLVYSEEPPVLKSLDPVDYNDDLCPSKGDRAVYHTSDSITINIFNHNYDEIVLTKNGNDVLQETYDGDSHCFYGLEPGIYSVFLQKGETMTAPVSFETLSTDVHYALREDGGLVVYFDTSTFAVYAATCTLQGDSLCYPISDRDRERGFIVIPPMNKPEYFCKVIFRGEYGRIINNPLRVQ